MKVSINAGSIGQVISGDVVHVHTPHALAQPDPTSPTLSSDASGVGMIKILFLCANPSDTSRLAIDREVRAIEERIRNSRDRDRFELEHAWAVRVEDLQARFMRDRPMIVHFSGHGIGQGEVVVEGDRGAAQAVDPRAFASVFRIVGQTIRCVVLNACFSESLAGAIADHVDCVIGMSNAVKDAAALAFAAGFYEGLGYGQSIQNAFDLGCNEVHLKGLTQAEVPRLVVKPGVRAAEVFLGGSGQSR